MELLGGSSWSAPAMLAIEQSGEERLSFRARWETRPFEDAYYYSARVALWKERWGWGLQLLHHKLYLTNPPPQIERFEFSHGWSLLTLQRARRGRVLDWRIGVGPVIAHAEGKVRGREVSRRGGLFGGYYLCGAAALAGVGKSFPIFGKLFATIEGDATFSWAQVPIREGHARTGNVALHALLGFGFSI
jgi:hypothetical protein